MSDPSLPSGWFPDPLGRHEHRYFNGRSWTSDVSDGGIRRVDPLGASAGGAASNDTPTNPAATAAVVLGSIAIVVAWIPFVVVAGAVLAVLALVFGVRGLRRSRSIGIGRNAAAAGIVMGTIGVGAAIVGTILTVVVWRAIVDYIEPGPVDAEVLTCAIDGRRVDVAGEITNRDDVAHDYTLFVELEGGTDFVVIEELGPGDTAGWDALVRARSIPESCEPELIVHGPFPFGIELDPVE